MFDLPRTRFPQSPLLILAGAIALGILLGKWITIGFQSFLIPKIVFITAFAVLSLASATAKPRLASLFLIAAFIFTGLSISSSDRVLGANRLATLFERRLLTSNDPVELTGTIEGQPEPAPQSYYVTLQLERMVLRQSEQDVSGSVLLMIPVTGAEMKEELALLQLRHGARIRVMTNIDRAEEFRNPGVSPSTEYLEREGLDATGVIKSPLLIERLSDERVFLPLAWLYQWRERLEMEFNARFSPETAGILNAALLGNRYNISQTAAERFRDGGTFHVLVVSGLNISFIGGLAFLLARLFTRRRVLQFLLSAGFLWAYTIAVGAEAPVARSALMFTLVVFAPIVWRRANSLNVVGGAALVLLALRPSDLFDPSFQLTFASVVAIVSVSLPLLSRMQQVGLWRPTMSTPYPPECPRWFRNLSEMLFWSQHAWQADQTRSNVHYRLFKTPLAARFESWRIQKLLRVAGTAIVVSASVQFGMMPLLVIYFHRLSWASLLLNVFVGGLMALEGLLALVSLVVWQLNVSLGATLIALVEKLSWLIIHSVDPFLRLGLASIRLPHYSGSKAIVYVIYLASLAALIIKLAGWQPLRPAIMTMSRPGICSRYVFRLAGPSFLCSLALIVFHPFSSARPDGKLHVDFLDVGQGDAALLTMPDGATLLIDGGGKPNFNYSREDLDDQSFQPDSRSIGERVVSEYLWSQGLDRIDYVVATHADADHIDGLNDVARNFQLRGALVARTPTDDPEYARFAETMRGRRVAVQRIAAGDLLRFGDVMVEVLWPDPNADPDAPSHNNDSLMLRIRFGERVFLLTGDIEKEGESGLLREGVNLRCDLIKVAHHGSKTSSIAEFTAAARPQLAVISVGRKSIFGHPNKEVVERWRASGAEVMTTGERGTISIITDGKELSVSTFGSLRVRTCRLALPAF